MAIEERCTALKWALETQLAEPTGGLGVEVNGRESSRQCSGVWLEQPRVCGSYLAGGEARREISWVAGGPLLYVDGPQDGANFLSEVCSSVFIPFPTPHAYTQVLYEPEITELLFSFFAWERDYFVKGDTKFPKSSSL